MRNAVIGELVKTAERDPRVTLVVGDLGFGVVDGFAQAYPGRFINAGISEQAMTSLAAGLALEGKIAFTYSIGNFPTLRCLEQIRNDVCANNLNVKIIAVGSGFSYGQLGMSHHATEDIAAMRALPNMRVLAPADPMEGAAALRAAYAWNGPCYLRLGRGGEKNTHPDTPDFDIWHAVTLAPQADVNILASGSIAAEAQSAARLLETQGIRAGVFGFPSIKPLDAEAVRGLAESSHALITVEEHNTAGGFGGAVAETVAGMRGARAAVIRLGLQDIFTPGVGDTAWLRARCGIDAAGIARAVAENMR